MIRESTENYLETIYILLQRMGSVRSIDVCNEMGYSKPTISVVMKQFRENKFMPTISVVMKQFRENKYIEMDGNGYITLTPSGLEIAQKTYERHLVLSEMLMKLGVSKENAVADACKIEHDISQETFDCIKRHMAAHKKEGTPKV